MRGGAGALGGEDLVRSGEGTTSGFSLLLKGKFLRWVSVLSYMKIDDYPYGLRRRYTETQPHARLRDWLDQGRDRYRERLHGFLVHAEMLGMIPLEPEFDGSPNPHWQNGFLPGLDIVALYGLLGELKPASYLEIGSGNSTKVARKAIRELALNTRIHSIDPFPRAEVDSICDEVTRKSLEECDLSVFGDLKSGDIVFFDGSHRLLQDSDVTVFFLDILPRLPKGVIVQIHDITLPFDYPEEWKERLYSENYVLATALLMSPEKFEVILPNAFISEDGDLREILYPLWERFPENSIQRHGGSFWFRWLPS
jgi:hypothetical protein